MQNKNKGFTLIELIVVIGILTILLAIVIIAINPSRQFAQARNTQRRSDVAAILNAVYQFAADNTGTLPASIAETSKLMGVAVGEADICSDLVPTYLGAMPFDPTASGASYTSCAAYETKYTIIKSSGTNPRVTVAAPTAELSATISITR